MLKGPDKTLGYPGGREGLSLSHTGSARHSSPEIGEGVSHKICVGKNLLDKRKCKYNVLKLECNWSIPRMLKRPE